MNIPPVNTPGVYIDELNAFPNSVVPVATAVPAFIGYTPTAAYHHEADSVVLNHLYLGKN